MCAFWNLNFINPCYALSLCSKSAWKIEVLWHWTVVPYWAGLVVHIAYMLTNTAWLLHVTGKIKGLWLCTLSVYNACIWDTEHSHYFRMRQPKHCQDLPGACLIQSEVWCHWLQQWNSQGALCSVQDALIVPIHGSKCFTRTSINCANQRICNHWSNLQWYLWNVNLGFILHTPSYFSIQSCLLCRLWGLLNIAWHSKNRTFQNPFLLGFFFFPLSLTKPILG